MSDNLLPLCNDLDGTLILDDCFNIGMRRLLREKPRAIPVFLFCFIFGGRPAAKAFLAKNFPIDPAKLPYRTELLDYLRAEKAKSRKLYLVSAANQYDVLNIAKHLGVFDGAYGSSEKTNLKGATKAAFILDNIGEKFAYAGDSFADYFVFKKAEAVILCGRARILRRVLHREVEATFPRPQYAGCDAAAPRGPRAR